MGNSFAYFCLFIWPLISIYFFKTTDLQKAILYTLFGAFLFLPVKTNINLPFFPALNKENISVLSVIIGCLLIRRKSVFSFKKSRITGMCLFGLLLSVVFTVYTNMDAIHAENLYLPALSSYDVLSMVSNQYLTIAPFFIGILYFSSYDSQVLVFKTIVKGALLYSIIVIFETRFSPQLHYWIYGYYPHADFSQQMRFGGFRPMGFIGHGLTVSFFIVVSLIAAFALAKNKISVVIRKPYNYIYLSFILVICKSAAAFLYGLYSMFIMSVFKPKALLTLSIIIASLAFTYPLTKIINIFPQDKILNLAYSINHERAGSLEFRFKNEDALLEKTNEKVLFGWGGWGRNRVYNDYGKDISVTDGRWIIQYSQYGFLGFFFYFILLFLPVFYTFRLRKKKLDNHELNIMAAHSLIIGFLMVDQILNSSLSPFYWLIAGCLFGRAYKLNSHIHTARENA